MDELTRRVNTFRLVMAFVAMWVTQAITNNEGWAWVAFSVVGALLWGMTGSALRNRR